MKHPKEEQFALAAPSDLLRRWFEIDAAFAEDDEDRLTCPFGAALVSESREIEERLCEASLTVCEAIQATAVLAHIMNFRHEDDRDLMLARTIARTLTSGVA